MNHKNQSWTSEHWVLLAQIVSEYKKLPNQEEFRHIASKHNKMCRTSRSASAVMNGFTRLREARLFANNEELWKIVSNNPQVFEVKHQRKSGSKKTGNSQRIDSLEKNIGEISQQVNMILEALTRKEP